MMIMTGRRRVTRAADGVGALPRFRGVPSYTADNVRSEFANIFSF